jgi:hypothetical protein
VVGALCSDMATLVEGAQAVVVVPPTRQMRLSRSLDGELKAPSNGLTRDSAAFERLKVSLKPFIESRVIVLNEATELEGVLTRILCQEGKVA